ncbi:MAG: putative toxin-antitoxin system toxin component, PIN family [Prevotellaceae bacterium]|jgi:putative PIN family toxin of toxin-antitoxin system|nr:putative toxin-antitoxin system toxin component, PIN family [Prevotellaceae bacterium]
MPKSSIIIDTNLWISFLLTKRYPLLDALLENNAVELIFSNELLNEFVEVVQRPKFQKFFSQEDTEALLQYIRQYARFVKVHSDVTVCRDTKDNFLLSLAQDSHADYLITGDKDLLSLNTFGKTKIIPMSIFKTL